MTTRWGGGATGECRRGEEAAGRCLIRRKCATCGEQTHHAYLRDGDGERAHYAEKRDTHVDVREAIADLIATLEACEVKVKWRTGEDSWKPEQVAMLLEWLNDNTFHLRLNGNEQPTLILAALEAAWLDLLDYSRDRGGWWRSVSMKDPDDTDYPPYRYRMFCSNRLERAEWESW